MTETTLNIAAHPRLARGFYVADSRSAAQCEIACIDAVFTRFSAKQDFLLHR
jgi:hypothetical protein